MRDGDMLGFGLERPRARVDSVCSEAGFDDSESAEDRDKFGFGTLAPDGKGKIEPHGKFLLYKATRKLAEYCSNPIIFGNVIHKDR